MCTKQNFLKVVFSFKVSDDNFHYSFWWEDVDILEQLHRESVITHCPENYFSYFSFGLIKPQPLLHRCPFVDCAESNLAVVIFLFHSFLRGVKTLVGMASRVDALVRFKWGERLWFCLMKPQADIEEEVEEKLWCSALGNPKVSTHR